MRDFYNRDSDLHQPHRHDIWIVSHLVLIKQTVCFPNEAVLLAEGANTTTSGERFREMNVDW